MRLRKHAFGSFMVTTEVLRDSHLLMTLIFPVQLLNIPDITVFAWKKNLQSVFSEDCLVINTHYSRTDGEEKLEQGTPNLVEKIPEALPPPNAIFDN